MRLLLIAVLLIPLSASFATTEQQEYDASLNTPEVKAIRKYLNDCLSGVDMGHPCEPNEAMPDNSIKGQPRESVTGEFSLLKVYPFNYGGYVYVIMFHAQPHLMAHVWVTTKAMILIRLRPGLSRSTNCSHITKHTT